MVRPHNLIALSIPNYDTQSNVGDMCQGEETNLLEFQSSYVPISQSKYPGGMRLNIPMNQY